MAGSGTHLVENERMQRRQRASVALRVPTKRTLSWQRVRNHSREPTRERVVQARRPPSGGRGRLAMHRCVCVTRLSGLELCQEPVEVDTDDGGARGDEAKTSVRWFNPRPVPHHGFW